jgi:hypothetical protein
MTYYEPPLPPIRAFWWVVLAYAIGFTLGTILL